MPWLHVSPGHQQPWYWPCRMEGSIMGPCLPWGRISMIKLSSQCWEMIEMGQIKFCGSQNNFMMTRVKMSHCCHPTDTGCPITSQSLRTCVLSSFALDMLANFKWPPDDLLFTCWPGAPVTCLFLPEASFGLRVLSSPASVCVCVSICVNHLLSAR